MGKRPRAPRRVAGAGFDLDHPCAQVGKQLGAKWPAYALPKVEDVDSLV